MRRRPKTVVETLPFEGVLRALGETHSDQLPVLDIEGRFEGLISYEEVKSALYDPALQGLVIARDLTTPVDDPLTPDEPLSAALERMDLHGAHSWPVVRDGLLLGMVRRSDAYAVARSGLSYEP
jgi:CBS domain-containing protein